MHWPALALANYPGQGVILHGVEAVSARYQSFDSSSYVCGLLPSGLSRARSLLYVVDARSQALALARQAVMRFVLPKGIFAMVTSLGERGGTRGVRVRSVSNHSTHCSAVAGRDPAAAPTSRRFAARRRSRASSRRLRNRRRQSSRSAARRRHRCACPWTWPRTIVASGPCPRCIGRSA